MDSSTGTAAPSAHAAPPEMSEEAKLRAKYGGALPRQQNMLTRKLMNKPKYFDSGDYNVAKAQGKLPASKPDPTAKNQSNNVEAADMVPETITGHEIPTPETLMPRKLSCATSLMSTPTATSSSAQSNNTLSPPSMQ